MCWLRTAVGFSLLLVATAAQADENGDLDRIPQMAPVAAPDAPSAFTGKFYVEANFSSQTSRASLAVPLPSSPSPSWESELFLDARTEWRVSGAVSFDYSGRLNLRVADGLAFPGHNNVRHDLREAYVAWQAGDGADLQLGRINLKSGVALGFNPTDFFKTRAVVEPLSADPSVLREDRLGTFMLLGQKVWNGFSLTLALAPKIAGQSAIYSDGRLPSFDPMFDRTNSETRFLAKVSVTVADDFSPELLFYRAEGHSRFGLNLTRAFGQSVVGYLEWAGGDRASLIRDALSFGRNTGTLPSSALAVLPQNDAHGFRSDLAAGLSYATAAQITFNFEYHYHQTGFPDADWKNWFDTGASGDTFTRGVLWYLRGYAGDQQEPVARSSLFLRADWQDGLVQDLDLAGFVETDLHDGSGFAQLSADYNVSREWSAGALVDTTFGNRRSDFGSLPDATKVLVKVSRYF